MYRTDKQFMKNPATASSRIYVGAIQKTVVADDLEAKFRNYGKILGLALNQGFAFIQFESDQEAQRAIQAENGSMLHGRKIVVKQALGKGGNNQGNQNQGNRMQNQNRQQNFGNNNQNFGNNQQKNIPPPANVPTPNKPNVPNENDEIIETEPKAEFQPPEQKTEEPMEEEVDAGPNIRPPPPNTQNEFENDRRNRKRGGRNRGNKSNDRFDPPQRDFNERGGNGNFYGGRGDFMPPMDGYGGIDAAPVVAPPPDRNDCEIIVVARSLTEYAEYIETRLKQLGLIVDLLFPNEDVPIGRVLANISSRGCLYAILVMPQNEEHRSLTLNMLHGLPQEHRNMPVDDAMLLIARNFEAYMRGDKIIPEDPLKMSLLDRHPPQIQMLFNLLAENRQITTNQYDKIIKYLQDRRVLQSEFEGVEGKNEENEPNKEVELQNRIMNILNKSDEPQIPMSITNPERSNDSSGPTPLLKDPTVQKALDSLVLGDIFKNIAA